MAYADDSNCKEPLGPKEIDNLSEVSTTILEAGRCWNPLSDEYQDTYVSWRTKNLPIDQTLRFSDISIPFPNESTSQMINTVNHPLWKEKKDI